MTTWRVVGVCALLCAAPGCNRRSDASDRVVEDSWARGDRVVVEVRAGEFFEARVVGTVDDALNVQRVDTGRSETVGPQEVYRLPPPPAEVHVGDLLICELVQHSWAPCRIQETGTDLAVVGLDGASQTLRAEQVVVPSRLTKLNLERRFKAQAQQARFRREAEGAGAPLVPPGWKPRPRESVLAARGSEWFLGTVHEIEKERVHVRWDANGRVTEIPLAGIVPLGTTDAPPGGSFVLARPLSPAEPWSRQRVKWAVDEEGVVLEDAHGQRTTHPLRDIVPLGTLPAR